MILNAVEHVRVVGDDEVVADLQRVEYIAPTLYMSQIYDRIVPSQSVRTALDYLLEPLVSSFWASVREN